MSIQVQDTLTRTLRPLAPPGDTPLGIYLCGPTVYDDSHIGHLMGPVLFDAVARWLRVRGYTVRFVNNITDIDDKIIRRSQATGEDWRGIATRFESRYRGYLSDLRVETITDHPHATDYVKEMLEFIARLIEEDRAYPASDGVYFDVQRQEGYGKLSGRDLDDTRSGERVAASEELRHPADFALWKAAKPGEPSWESPWGPGRPGWHLECSVMSRSLLGERFAVHGGGDDLKFPHHENEIAQSEARGDAFADHWMHHGLVQYGGKKVAKSDERMADPAFARQFQAAWLIEEYGAPTLRFFLLRGHYRRPIDFQPESLDGARKGLGRLLDLLGAACDEPLRVEGYGPAALDVAREAAGDAGRDLVDAFERAMDEDFNTGEALAQLFQLADRIRGDASNADTLRAATVELGRLLGLFHPGDREAVRGGASKSDAELDGALQLLIAMRAEARANKDFATSDRIRDELAAAGIELRDGADGTGWARKDS
ncbi:MAG: cysteine--tRNA ligase [Planctomycetota bacterium]|jgi:cysteinyl-tRNA synthetase